MIEFIDGLGPWLLRAEVIGVFFALVVILLAVILKGTGWIFPAIGNCLRAMEKDEKDVTRARTLLAIYRSTERPEARKERAEAFVRHGITFMKGPFRSGVNFGPEQLNLLPTNEELSEAVQRGIKSER